MKAIFHKNIEVRSRLHNVAWSIKASDKPQTFPTECIEIAVAAGAAEIVQPKRAGAKEQGGTPLDETGE